MLLLNCISVHNIINNSIHGLFSFRSNLICRTSPVSTARTLTLNFTPTPCSTTAFIHPARIFPISFFTIA
nr:hypothetical protein Iba_chr04dCG18560 [Ipomoea batatas]